MTTNLRKADLIVLCENAREVGCEGDPDGLHENKQMVINNKLVFQNVCLLNPEQLNGTPDITHLPPLSIFDLYNYLLSFKCYDHDSLREYHKLEGYTMFKDNYVIAVTLCTYNHLDFFPLRILMFSTYESLVSRGSSLRLSF